MLWNWAWRRWGGRVVAFGDWKSLEVSWRDARDEPGRAVEELGVSFVMAGGS